MSDLNLHIERKDLINISNSVWISASAGSGKTKILVDRIINLLINDVEPNQIIAIAFTNVAAKEMEERVMQKISDFASMNYGEAKQEIANLVQDNDELSLDKKVKSARNLLHKFLSNDHKLQIKTIHSLCSQIISKFAFAIDVSANFTLLDEREAKFLMEEAKDRFLTKIINLDESSSVKQAVSKISGRKRVDDFIKILEEVIRKRNQIKKNFIYFADIEELISEIASQLKFGHRRSEEQLKQEFREYLQNNSLDLDNIATQILSSSKATEKDLAKANIIKNIVNNFELEDDLLEDFISVFLTEKHTNRKNIFTKSIASQYPDIEEQIRDYQNDIYQFVNDLKSAILISNSRDLLIIFNEIDIIYENLKLSKNVLDYNDLIFKTLKLIYDKENSDWILYILDNSISHILVDEAQDVSPEQWQIIYKICEEYFSGDGAFSDIEKNIFIVGDEKQSIYRFQGADIDNFYNIKEDFANKIKTANKNFVDGKLIHSYRTVPIILQLVDDVFSDPFLAKAISKQNEIKHIAKRENNGGLIELWSVNIEDEQDSKPDDAILEDIDILPKQPKNTIDKEIIFADIIAKQIKNWLDQKRIIVSKNRVVTNKDIMILFPKRGRMMDYISKSLLAYGIENSGSDRINLSKYIVIKDILAIAKFLLLPDDDLNLATLLKSPIFDLSEEELLDLCYDRNDIVWNILGQKQHSNPKYQKTYEYLDNLLLVYKDYSISELFLYIVQIMGIKNLFQKYFGNEVNEPINLFLNEVLNFENKNIVADLNDFISYFEQSEMEIKRDININKENNQVKLVSVHGSKGLEAPIVIIVENINKGNKSQDNILLYPYIHKNFDLTYLPIYSLEGVRNYNDIISNFKEMQKEKEIEENNRLLYVAMTRSEDELYIVGHDNNNENSWHNIIKRKMEQCYTEYKTAFSFKSSKLDKQINADGFRIGNIRYDSEIGSEDRNINQTKLLTENNNFVDISNFDKILSDSKLKRNIELKYNDNNNYSDFYIKRGICIHKLLEIIPNIESEIEKNKKITEIINEYIPEITDDQRNDIKDKLSHITTKFSELFKKHNSFAEVPLMTRNQDGKFVQAKIDRLVIEDNKVIIVEYKTGQTNDDIDVMINKYKKQINSYQQFIKNLYPNKEIEGLLILFDKSEQIIL